VQINNKFNLFKYFNLPYDRSVVTLQYAIDALDIFKQNSSWEVS